jgi:hypothetical protein
MNTAYAPRAAAPLRGTPSYVPWINIAVGILAIISPWIVGPIPRLTVWVDVAPGIVLVVVGFIALSAAARPERSGWPWINVCAGIWLLIALIWTHGNAALSWSNIVLGVLAIITGLVSVAHMRLASPAPLTSEAGIDQPSSRRVS